MAENLIVDFATALYTIESSLKNFFSFLREYFKKEFSKWSHLQANEGSEKAKTEQGEHGRRQLHFVAVEELVFLQKTYR